MASPSVYVAVEVYSHSQPIPVSENPQKKDMRLKNNNNKSMLPLPSQMIFNAIISCTKY